MAEALYPERRGMYHVDDHPEAPRILEAWVKGRDFHPYVPPRFVSWEDRREWPEYLELHGQWVQEAGYLRWSLRYQRVGEPDSRGFHSGAGGVNAICYSALSMIEAHDREMWPVAKAVAA